MSLKLTYHYITWIPDPPTQSVHVSFNDWDEPEQALHIRSVCEFHLSVCLSVGLYVRTMIIYIYGGGIAVLKIRFVSLHLSQMKSNRQLNELRSKFIDP